MERRSFFGAVAALLSFPFASAAKKSPPVAHDRDVGEPWVFRDGDYVRVAHADVREGDTMIMIGWDERSIWKLKHGVVSKSYFEDGKWWVIFEGGSLDLMRVPTRAAS